MKKQSKTVRCIICLGLLVMAAGQIMPAGAEEKVKAKKIKIKKTEDKTMTDWKAKDEKYWKEHLSAEQFHVLREKGTESSFKGAYWDNHEKGLYRCAGCGLELFSSEAKFDSGTGWPSFWQPISDKNVEKHSDKSFLMVRTEVLCPRCGGHLGHVFEDGPAPTGLRYCINSAALVLEKTSAKADNKSK